MNFGFRVHVFSVISFALRWTPNCYFGYFFYNAEVSTIDILSVIFKNDILMLIYSEALVARNIVSFCGFRFTEF